MVITRSSIGGKQDGPLFGMLPVASTVNTDLKWRFSVSAFSLGLVIIRFQVSVLMPVLSFLFSILNIPPKSFLLSESLEDVCKVISMLRCLSKLHTWWCESLYCFHVDLSHYKYSS